jgi:hypothetical protein
VEYRAEANALLEINSIPLHKVKEQVDILLKDNQAFTYVKLPVSRIEMLESLNNNIKQLFLEYEFIETKYEPKMRIDRNLIRPSSNSPGFTLIGFGLMGSDIEYEICVKKDNEKIYAVYENEPPDPKFGIYQSIYHWLLATRKLE